MLETVPHTGDRQRPMHAFRLLLAALVVRLVESYSQYRSAYPHGYDIVAAAGHYGGRGSSSNVNAFGNDLDNSGLRWTRAMCTRDR